MADFWTLLHDLEAKNQLPPEIYLLEIGVGTGVRCGMWLTKFRTLDQERGTDYYPKLRVLLGDYSLATLDMSKPAVEDHADLCSFLVLDAMNPLKTLSFLRHKIMQVHSTNVYDNLPDEEVVRRDGKLYFVQVRAYLPMADVVRLSDRVRRSAGQTALHGQPFAFRQHRISGRSGARRGVLDGPLERHPSGRTAGAGGGSSRFPFSAGPGRAEGGGHPQGSAQRFSFSPEFGRAGEFFEHASAAASARLSCRCRIFS